MIEGLPDENTPDRASEEAVYRGSCAIAFGGEYSCVSKAAIRVHGLCRGCGYREGHHLPGNPFFHSYFG